MTALTTAPAVRVVATHKVTEPSVRKERFGVHLQDDGVDVVLLAAAASTAWLCLLDDDGTGGLAETRYELLPTSQGRWHGHLPGIGAGRRYGFRVDGAWDPAHGLRHNPAKLLLDPYARGIVGGMELRPEVYGHVVGEDLRPTADEGPDPRDSAPFVPHGVIMAGGYGGDVTDRPRTTWSRTVVYEAHVIGLTRLLPGVPEELRGTYAGLAHPATIAHLKGLGVTAVELLPIQAKISEPALTRRGVENYWGYNTIGFFAPEASYATAAAQAAGPEAVLVEVKGMVQLLHEAGLEVILDVVYNHTSEGGSDGPTLSLRGLHDGAWYRHADGDASVYEDVTGCGNSLDYRNPRAVQLALDSLRYWAGEVGVDGFRFDLAVTLGRGPRGFEPDHPFLVAAAADPVLSGRKLIAEPWDVGPFGWRTGGFNAPFAEWNDKYRDCLRTFWVSDQAALRAGRPGHDLRDLATRLAGSADMFGHGPVPGGRGPIGSVNFVTAHDGFTLADLVSYDHKHNEANGEDGRDGTANNRSWNHGVEGPTDDPAIRAARARTMRNLIGSMAVAAGTPMLTAGDEFARTQGGNNNPYCLNSPVTWMDWDLDGDQRDLLATASHLFALRREHPVLRPWRYRTATPDGRSSLAWYDEGGRPMSLDAWHDANRRVLQMARVVTGTDTGRSLLVVVNGAVNDVQVTLTEAEESTYELVWDSVWERPQAPEPFVPAGTTVTMPGLSMRVYLAA